jgi:dipeptidyl aminopeptidase/acylaminoacyl peptidase
MARKNQFMLIGIFFFFLIFLSTIPITEAQKNSKKITYNQTYLDAEPRLFNPLPSMVEWLDDAHYLVIERDEIANSQKLFKVSAADATKTLFLDYGQIQTALPEDFRASQHIGITEDYSGLLYSAKGDLYYYSRPNDSFKHLTATSSEECNPRLSPDGKYVAFTRDHNLYSMDIASGLEYQLTADRSETIMNGWASWVYYEEILGRRSRHAAFWWSPDSRKIAFLRFDDSPVPTFPLFSSIGDPGSSDVSNSYPRISQLYLAQEGIDHRGSGHFGKQGMALMHRNLGKWEMFNLIHGVKWLHKKSFVDKSRIGITGESYGGYTTCMALTYGADYFTHGCARSSVTDWRLYDSVYTERYMDRPVENHEGYKFGAAMTHANRLKGILFMSHGDLDDNVHMQNTIQLIDKFMDLGKSTFEFMVYPDQKHATRGKKPKHSNRHYIDFWFKHFLNR